MVLQKLNRAEFDPCFLAPVNLTDSFDATLEPVVLTIFVFKLFSRALITRKFSREERLHRKPIDMVTQTDLFSAVRACLVAAAPL